MMVNTLFLNFFSDSEKWDNLILCPAYPFGMSYFRPFRYRNKWISAPLIKKISDGKFDYSSGIIGACFLGKDHINKVLPIRKIYNLHLNNRYDDYDFNFTCGEMLDFTYHNNLENLVLTLPEYEDVKDRDDAFLLMESQLSIEKLKFTDGSDDSEIASWTKYSELLCNEQNIPIHDKARSSIFLRLSEMGRTDNLYKSKNQGSIFGLALKEGQSKEICVHHRVPCLLDHHLHLPNLEYEHVASTTNIEFNSQYEMYSGNYQTHNVILTGLSIISSFSTIHIKCKQKEIKVNEFNLHTHDLNIPAKVKFSFLYRLLNQWLLVALFGLGILLTQFDKITNTIIQCDISSQNSICLFFADYLDLFSIIGTIISTVAFALYSRRLK